MDPWEAVPAEWVPLHHVPKQIANRFGRDAHDVAVELVSALRRHQLAHKVVGVVPRPSSPSLPPGLKSQFWRDQHSVGVQDWFLAEADWATGTVGGWRGEGGKRDRHPVELLWSRIEKWFPTTALFHRRSQAEEPSTTVAPAGQIAKRPSPQGRFSQLEVDNWYRRRVDGWPKDISSPTEEDDFKAARTEFPQVTRGAVRSARKRLAPAKWTARGRRKTNPRE
jgi:hypothetical protein